MKANPRPRRRLTRLLGDTFEHTGNARECSAMIEESNQRQFGRLRKPRIPRRRIGRSARSFGHGCAP